MSSPLPPADVAGSAPKTTSILAAEFEACGLQYHSLMQSKNFKIRTIVERLGSLDTTARLLCDIWDKPPPKGSNTPKTREGRTLIWVNSYDDIEYIITGLLAVEGSTVRGIWDASEPNPFPPNILETVDNEHCLFHSHLGLPAKHHIRRFGDKNRPISSNVSRENLDRLKAYGEWYRNSPRLTLRLPSVNGIQLKYPDANGLRDGYTAIISALVKCLKLCLELDETRIVIPCNDDTWSIGDELQWGGVRSVTTDQLMLTDSDNSDDEWGFVQSSSKESKPSASPAVTSTKRQATPALMTSPVKEKVGNNIERDLEFKPKPPLNTSLPNAVSVVPTKQPVLVLRPNQTDTQKAASPPVQSKTGSLKVADEANRKLLEQVKHLQQELDNERTERAIEKRILLANMKKRNDSLVESEKHFKVLLQNEQQLTKERDDALASKATLSKGFSDVAEAKHAAEKDKEMAKHKLELTQQEVASLKKELTTWEWKVTVLKKEVLDLKMTVETVNKERAASSKKVAAMTDEMRTLRKKVGVMEEEVERAKEEGRHEIRSQISFTLYPILHPPPERKEVPSTPSWLPSAAPWPQSSGGRLIEQERI